MDLTEPYTRRTLAHIFEIVVVERNPELAVIGRVLVASAHQIQLVMIVEVVI
ncbi:hypothetical protein D3C81_2342310 [compost metagenome]